MQISEPALAFFDVGFELIAAVAEAPVPGVALGELAVYKLRRAAAHDFQIKAFLQLYKERLLAPEIASLKQPGADGQIGLGVAQAFLNRAGRVPDFQADVPQQIKQILDDLLGMRGPFVGEQKQQIDVGIGRQLAPPIAADGDKRQPFARGRVGERIDVVGGEVEQCADQLVDQKTLLAHHRRPIVGLFKTTANLGPPGGQRRLQRRDEQSSIEGRRWGRTSNDRELLAERSPVDDVTLPRNAGHAALLPPASTPCRDILAPTHKCTADRCRHSFA